MGSSMKTNKNISSNPCQGLSPWVHHSRYQLTMVRRWWSIISIIRPWSGVGGQLLTSSSHDMGWWSATKKKQTDENTERKHKDRKHRQETQTENTDRKHREKKTQRENTERKHTDRKQTDRKHTERKHREKTQRENTEIKQRQKTQRENTDRSTTQHYKVLHDTIPYYIAPHATTLYYKVLHSTPRRSREPSPGPPASKARQIFCDDSKDRDSKYNARSYRADTKHKRSHAQAKAQSNSNSSKFAFRHSFARSTHRILREGSSGKIKMCVSLQRRAIQNFKMYVSLQWRAQKCMKQTPGVCGRPRHTKIIVLPQFRTSDQREVTKGLHRRRKNLHFTAVLDVTTWSFTRS